MPPVQLLWGLLIFHQITASVLETTDDQLVTTYNAKTPVVGKSVENEAKRPPGPNPQRSSESGVRRPLEDKPVSSLLDDSDYQPLETVPIRLFDDYVKIASDLKQFIGLEDNAEKLFSEVSTLDQNYDDQIDESRQNRPLNSASGDAGWDGNSTLPPVEPRENDIKIFPEDRTASGAGRGGLPCGYRVLKRRTYILLSKNHPRNYDNYLYCGWQLRAAFTSDRMTLRCSSFSLESHSRCRYDWLAVNGQRYCGSSRPSVSNFGSMNVEFSTDYSVTRSGFRCTVTVSGGSEITTTTPSPGDCLCGVPNRRSRIVGGVSTLKNEYPWQAALVFLTSRTPFCGGTIINNQWILTAAHCTSGSMRVLVREHRTDQSDGEILLQVSRVVPHPSYTSPSGSGYDFALLRLATPLNFGSFANRVAPACLPTNAAEQYVGRTGVVSGWGAIREGGPQSSVLREVNVPIISNSACRSIYSSITSTMVCAGTSGRDSCQGDSGGPMTVLNARSRYEVVGVVSFGRGCARPNFPGVYARVTAVLGWISSTTAGSSTCP